MGEAFLGPELIGLPSPKELNMSSPNMPPKPEPRLLPPIPPNGLEKPKNSAKMSLAFLGLNLNCTFGPSPVWKNVDPPASGGTCPLSPSSPYWSYIALFWGSLRT